ncbi:lysylphosphatidylglycerol synthase transmembrane domain-containing protein [Viscerimonas tarda]
MEQSVEEKSPKKSIVGKIAKFVLPLALGILILYFLFRDINFSEVWSVLKDANYAILAFSLIFGLLGNTIRGYRWDLLIRPLGYKAKVSTLNYAIYGGYAVNFVFARAGEIWRCGIVAKEEKIPFTKLFGTMILDRVLDTLTVLSITVIAFFLNMQFLLKANQERIDAIHNILTSPILYIAIVALVLALFVIFKFFGQNFIVKKIVDLVAGMGKDMKIIWKMKTKKRLFLYSIGIWASYFFYFYITFFAFGFTKDLGFTAALVAFALSSISMGVPSNGGLGPWQLAVIASLTIYGVDTMSATAFATGVFAIQSLWVILCGLVGIAMLAVRKKN